MITRARWQRIQSVFEELADVPPEERDERLARSCGEDTELRRSVESLLASDQRTADPVQNAIGAAAETLLIEHRDRMLGAHIGHYRIVSILGHGGMSTVYRAERDDAQYQQTVAIKVLHHSALHPRLRSRLHSERHILATLAHPSIARLIDSGELEDGTPYLVMEHVDGESIAALFGVSSFPLPHPIGYPCGPCTASSPRSTACSTTSRTRRRSCTTRTSNWSAAPGSARRS